MVWARRGLNIPFRRFSARAVQQQGAVQPAAAAEVAVDLAAWILDGQTRLRHWTEPPPRAPKVKRVKVLAPRRSLALAFWEFSRRKQVSQ